jgi:hypothetical protein
MNSPQVFNLYVFTVCIYTKVSTKKCSSYIFKKYYGLITVYFYRFYLGNTRGKRFESRNRKKEKKVIIRHVEETRAPT